MACLWILRAEDQHQAMYIKRNVMRSYKPWDNNRYQYQFYRQVGDLPSSSLRRLVHHSVRLPSVSDLMRKKSLFDIKFPWGSCRLTEMMNVTLWQLDYLLLNHFEPSSVLFVELAEILYRCWRYIDRPFSKPRWPLKSISRFCRSNHRKTRLLLLHLTYRRLRSDNTPLRSLWGRTGEGYI